MIWCILAIDMDQCQQCAAIINQLRGDAAQVGLNLSYLDMTQGGLVQGVQQDPFNYLLYQLAQAFAPLGEEARMQAMRELMSFQRDRNETIDSLLSKIRITRWKAAMGNAGIQMSWEGYTWILLRTIGVSSQDLISILQPVQGQFPSTEPEFEAMCMTIRRMGHIRENAPHNIAHALRGDRGNTMFAESPNMAFPVTPYAQAAPAAPDPWMTADPWGGQAANLPQAFQQQQSAMPETWSNQHHQSQPTQSPQAFPIQTQWQAGESDADTDSNTESSLGDAINYAAPEFAGLTHPQISEKLWWNMARSKSLWRKHMNKPVRKARRFFKKSFPQLRQPKGKGKGRYHAMTNMDAHQHDQVFFGGKGSSKGKHRTTGKGFGRRTNPTGPH